MPGGALDCQWTANADASRGSVLSVLIGFVELVGHPAAQIVFMRPAFIIAVRHGL